MNLRLVLDRDQVLQPALLHHPAFENDADVVADLLHLFQQVRAQENRDPALPQLENQIPDLPRADRIHAGRRLVENHQPRLLHQRLGQPDALQHALRVAADPPVAGAFQIHQAQQFAHPVFQDFALQAAEFAVKPQGLRAAQVFVEIGILRQETDVVARVHLQRVLAENRAGAGRRGHQPQQRLHRRRFARSVRPDQPVNLARHDPDRDPVHRPQHLLAERRPEVLHQVFDFNSGSVFSHR